MEGLLHDPTVTPDNYTPTMDFENSNSSGVMATEMEQYKHFYETAQFTTGLILYPIICVIGITGNVLVLIVLSQQNMKNSTNVFLSALAVADLVKLLNDTLYFIVSILLRTHPLAGNQMLGYMYPVSHYIFNGSVCIASWLTVCIGLERFLYVCRISQARTICTVRRARIASCVVFFVMAFMAIPSALRYKRVTVIKDNRTMFEIGLTALGQNEHFMSVYMWTISLLRSVIPLCILVVLNYCIFQALRKHRIKGKVSRKNRITFMLIVVIVVFVVCITPDAIMSTVFGFGYVEASYLVKGIRECTDALLAANSAVNFTIYCVCSKRFRDTCREVFCQAPQNRNLPVVRLDSVVRPDVRHNSSRPLLMPELQTCVSEQTRGGLTTTTPEDPPIQAISCPSPSHPTGIYLVVGSSV